MFVLLCLFFGKTQAQLNLCSGNSGDPIFTEDFGTGTQRGPELAPGITTYNYVQNGPPFDGEYTTSDSTGGFFPDWLITEDHTPNDIDGKLLIVNASFQPDEFYRTTVTGLCANTTYGFSAWALNLYSERNEGCGDPRDINLRFQIWDETDTMLLVSGDTGDIGRGPEPIWMQFGLTFMVAPGQDTVILKILNNGQGGCGNDLAIDDIEFSTCGDEVLLTDSQGETSITECANEDGTSATLTATPDFSVFQTHFYQWQESEDGQIWTDIAGETSETYTTPVLTMSRFYRVKVAESMANLSDDLCNILSDVYSLIITPQPDPPTSDGNVSSCANDLMSLSVSHQDEDVSINWYDAPTGGNLLLEDNPVFTPDTPGTFYAEAILLATNCQSATRTPVTLEINANAEELEENATFCEGESTVLNAGPEILADFLWSTNETTATITVAEPGSYTVTGTDTNGCPIQKTILLEQIELPVIDRIESDGVDVRVILVNQGTFEYALDDGPFQSSPFFEAVPSGPHQIAVRGATECNVVTQEFLHIAIPNFFTPNGDGTNDLFLIENLDAFSIIEINIFDRFGKLLRNSNNQDFTWDGTFNGRPLPSSDYWYTIRLDDSFFRGNFTLKR